MTELFFELIRVALGKQKCLSRNPSAKEWKRLFKMAERQRLLGICFYGVKKVASPKYDNEAYPHPLPEGKGENKISIPGDLYDYWLGTAALIQQQNHRMNKYTEETVKLFRENGFPCCVMKGQSVARLYNEGRRTKDERPKESNSLGMFRQSGDIDIWVASGREKLCEFSMQRFGRVDGMTYHDVHIPLWKDTEVEAHFKPGNMFNPFHDKKLQKFFKQYEPTMDSSIDAPAEFNVIYILQHCFKHFLERGIGMRQVMDYYFVLQSRRPTPTPSLYSEGNLETTLRECGLLKFARAMMWVLQHVFEENNVDEERRTKNEDTKDNWRERYPWMIVEPLESEGRFILHEVMQGGNFGKFDKRIKKGGKRSKLQAVSAVLQHNLHLLKHYPSDVIWAPIWIVYHYIWKRTVGR